MSSRALSEGEAFLRDWHRVHAGATSFCLADGRSDGERSSYELLAEVVPQGGSGLCVLDLGCGDGFLLEFVLTRRQGPTRAIGVDMSVDELALARRRLGPGGVELLCERAQAMSIADASVDYLLSHMAFMLLDDIETVVSEIGRVLRSGGTFSAMVGTPSPVRDALSVFVAIQRSLLERTGAVIPQLGDPRTQSADGLRALLGKASGFLEPIDVRQLLLRLEQAPDRIFENLSLMYPFDLLGADSQRELEREFSAQVKPLVAADGRVGCTFGLLQVTCVRAERVHRD